MTRHVSDLLNYSLALIMESEADVAPSKVFAERSGAYHWEQVHGKLEAIFKHIFALRRTYRVRHEGLLAVLAFLESCSRKSWEIPRFDKTSLYAPQTNAKLEAFTRKFGTKDDPMLLATNLAAKVAAMEKKNEELAKQLATKSSGGTPAGFEEMKTKLANLGTNMSQVQTSLGALNRLQGGAMPAAPKGGGGARQEVGGAKAATVPGPVAEAEATLTMAAMPTMALSTVQPRGLLLTKPTKPRSLSSFGSIARLRYAPCCRPPRLHGTPPSATRLPLF
jgi:hypothetical protein